LSVTAANGGISIDSGAPGSRFTGFPAASLKGLRDLGHMIGNPSDISAGGSRRRTHRQAVRRLRRAARRHRDRVASEPTEGGAETTDGRAKARGANDA
jgi:hypothetical protein